MIELMRGLDRLPAPAWRLVAGRNANRLLTAEKEAGWYGRHVVDDAPSPPRRSLLTAWRNETAFARQVQAASGSIVHRSYHPLLDRLPRAVTVVETVHDMWDFVASDERDSRALLRRHLKRRALERADRIICVSRSTCQLLGDRWPALAARAVVIPHGSGRLAERPEPVRRARPFFLFVGRRDRYKNFAVLLDALRGVAGEADLICFGGGAFTAGEQDRIARRGLAARLHHEEGGDRWLAGHYEAALALLYPSRHEGFGLPLLEAMNHGCPVVAAPLTSLPEVGGDAALYADADDAEAWAAIMQSLLDDADRRTRCAAAGRERAADFSWAAAARSHAALYADMGAA